MVQLSPAKRLSADDYLARWQDSFFPQSFETFLRPFMRTLQVGWWCISSCESCACSITAVTPMILASSELTMVVMQLALR